MSTRIKVSPKKILWAAERGGISIEKLYEVYPKSKEWVREDSLPTVKQLESFSKKVHVPFGFLFLENPPTEKLPITFYRSNGSTIENPPLVVRDMVNDLKTKQEWLRDYLIESNFDKHHFIGTLKDFNDICITKSAEKIRKSLKLNKTWYQETNKAKAFRYWIDKIEKNRIFIISTGFFKHQSRKIDVEICKGFTLVDDYCPFIYINTNNLGGGKIFTLIHELVHVFVGTSLGVGYEPIKPTSIPLERFCDGVASEILVPQEYFESSWKSYSENTVEKFSILSNLFNVSKLVIARKALDSNFIQNSEFWDFYNSYTSITINKSTGGSYWNSKPYSVSRKFYDFVDSAMKQGKILPTQAYKLTEMKGKTYEKFKKHS